MTWVWVLICVAVGMWIVRPVVVPMLLARDRLARLERREGEADRLLWDADSDFAHSAGVQQPRGAKRRPSGGRVDALF